MRLPSALAPFALVVVLAAGCTRGAVTSAGGTVTTVTSAVTTVTTDGGAGSGVRPAGIPPTPAGLDVVHTPATLALDERLDPGQCHATVADAGEGLVLPDPTCTPGAIDPAVTQANIYTTICSRGYTARVRPAAAVTDKFKAVADAAYGESYSHTTELDHLVALELGGASSASNLWPEPNRAGATSTTNPKDAVEDRLHKDVCDGTMTLRAAQEAIARNWTTAGD